MGCDIHAHVEIERNGKWIHWARPRIPRSYQLFERMAGVRGDTEKAIVPPKGLPGGLTESTILDRQMDDSDGHSESWLSSSELAQIESEFSDFDEECGWLFGNGVAGFLQGCDPDASALGVTDVRLVFWFDN